MFSFHTSGYFLRCVLSRRRVEILFAQVIAGGLGTGSLAIFSLWRCLKGGVVIKILSNNRGSPAGGSNAVTNGF